MCIKYGLPIGYALADIAAGVHVPPNTRTNPQAIWIGIAINLVPGSACANGGS